MHFLHKKVSKTTLYKKKKKINESSPQLSVKINPLDDQLVNTRSELKIILATMLN